MEERNVYYTNSIEIETTAFDVKLILQKKERYKVKDYAKLL